MKIDYRWIFFVALLILYTSFANNYIGSNADDSIYVVLGKSLAEGNGYRMISSPENYVNVEYPPLFPVFIAGIFILGGNIFVIKLLITVLGVLSIYSLYLFLKKFLNDKKAFIITVLTGISPLFIFYAHQVLSEVPYFLFSILALYFFVKYLDNSSNKNLLLCSLFVLLSYFIRTIGFVLIVAMGLYVAFEKLNKKDLRKFIFIILIIALPILLWSVRILSNEGETYEQYSYKDIFLRNNLYDFDSGGLDINGILNRVLYNGEKHIIQFSKTVFDPINWASLFYPNLKWLEFSIISIVFLIIVFGLILSLIKNRTIIEYYFLTYVFFIFLIPDPSSRFLFPVIPFIINYFLKGAEFIFKKLDKKRVINLLVVLIVICSVLSISKDIYFEHKEDYYLNNWGENVDGFVDMALWSKDNIPKENNVIVYNPMMFYLLSDIKGNSPYLSYNKEEVLNQIYKKNAEYVIIDKGVGKRYLSPVIDKEHFEKIYERDGNHIYRVIYSD